MTDMPGKSGLAIRLAVSSCLLGQKVRFDGGHKRNGYLTNSLARYFEMIPFCPEDEKISMDHYDSHVRIDIHGCPDAS